MQWGAGTGGLLKRGLWGGWRGFPPEWVGWGGLPPAPFVETYQFLLLLNALILSFAVSASVLPGGLMGARPDSDEATHHQAAS